MDIFNNLPLLDPDIETKDPKKFKQLQEFFKLNDKEYESIAWFNNFIRINPALTEDDLKFTIIHSRFAMEKFPMLNNPKELPYCYVSFDDLDKFVEYFLNNMNNIYLNGFFNNHLEPVCNKIPKLDEGILDYDEIMNADWILMDYSNGTWYLDKSLAIGLIIKRSIADQFLHTIPNYGMPLFKYFAYRMIKDNDNMKKLSKNQRKKANKNSFLGTKVADDLYDLYEMISMGLFDREDIIILDIHTDLINDENQSIDWVIEFFKFKGKWLVCIVRELSIFYMSVNEFLDLLPWKLAAEGVKFKYGIIKYCDYYDSRFKFKQEQKKYNNYIEIVNCILGLVKNIDQK